MRFFYFKMLASKSRKANSKSFQEGNQAARKPHAKGGGRPTKEATLLREELKARMKAEKIADAEYAFALYAETMRDTSQKLELRLDCADWVAQRVLGKPTQPTVQDERLAGLLARFFGDDEAANTGPVIDETLAAE